MAAELSSPAKAAEDSSAPAKREARKMDSQGAASAAGKEKTTEGAKKVSVSAEDDDEDLEISDEEGLAAGGDGLEVDEDWGEDWE